MAFCSKYLSLSFHQAIRNEGINCQITKMSKLIPSSVFLLKVTMILNVGSNIPLIFFFSVFTYMCLTINYFTLFVFNFLTSRSFSYRLLLPLLRLNFIVSFRLPRLVVWALQCTRVPSQGRQSGGQGG